MGCISITLYFQASFPPRMPCFSVDPLQSEPFSIRLSGCQISDGGLTSNNRSTPLVAMLSIVVDLSYQVCYDLTYAWTQFCTSLVASPLVRVFLSFTNHDSGSSAVPNPLNSHFCVTQLFFRHHNYNWSLDSCLKYTSRFHRCSSHQLTIIELCSPPFSVPLPC